MGLMENIIKPVLLIFRALNNQIVAKQHIWLIAISPYIPIALIISGIKGKNAVKSSSK